MSARYVGGVVDTATERGADPYALLRGTALTADALRGAGRVPSSVVRLIWERALDRLGDRRLGLHVGSRLGPGAYHVLGHALLASATLGDAAALTVRYHRLVSDAGLLRFTEDGERAVLRYRRLTPPGDADVQQTEAVMAGVVTAARWLSPDAWRPVRVTFAHPAPCGTAQAWEAELGAPVVFGAGENRIEWPALHMVTALPYGDAGLLRLHRTYADRLLAAHGHPVPVSRRATAWLAERDLATVRPDDLARALHMSTRSLRRALREDGASWRNLLDEARRGRAVRWVVGGDLSLSEIARRLGYGDTSSLVRAFHRWEGMPPGRYAREATRGERPQAPYTEE
ncbi:AraC family transcriptional regulator [Streptomyces viridochromogenes]|uniref:Putative transcriptional regulator, AraC family n=1 Tax=Streptomyces viridochromogenes Tue57 TaxID=1160705 RepID=L8PNU5_STRVR|nr:AraC family transcriptional regulator [Streptomyces viridochromogenes]ELS57744.1 putative transcriptional regulator, AraC family [Streptomyces viridochromogenes Tue57]